MGRFTELENELISKHFGGMHNDDITDRHTVMFARELVERTIKNSPKMVIFKDGTFINCQNDLEASEYQNDEHWLQTITVNGAMSGMYGEMPKIQIGKYTIADMSNEANCSTVWIENTETGEGGQFSKHNLIDVLHKFYKEFF
jgi:hypothetical protein